MRQAIAAIGILALATAWAQAQSVPQLVNYQGKLTDINGNPLASGSYVMEFNIYAVKTGGTPIWGPLIFDNGTAAGHGPKVSIVNGQFNVFLGPVDTSNRPIAAAFAGSTTYLGIKVTSGTWSAGLTEISPRQQILSAPYALQAADADTVGRGRARAGTGSLADQLVVPNRTSIGAGYANNAAPTDGLIVQGNVGIGTNNPQRLLHVLGASRLEGILTAVSAAIGNGYLGNTPPTNGLIVQGNVGIGKTAPSEKLEVDGRIKDKTGWVMPVGTILPYGGDAANFDGWLVCDGSAVSRTTYADLFAVIGTRFGAGNGSTTFNLPNLKGRVVVGYDASQAEFNIYGKTGGAKTHTLAPNEVPQHRHSYTDLYPHDDHYTHSSDPYYSGDIRVGDGDGTNQRLQNWNTGYAFGNAGGGTDPHNNLQPYITLTYIIKY